jgi:hypothetical protein
MSHKRTARVPKSGQLGHGVFPPNRTSTVVTLMQIALSFEGGWPHSPSSHQLKSKSALRVIGPFHVIVFVASS